MIVKNKINGKQVFITKENWEKIAVLKKANFVVVNDKDTVEEKSPVQIVQNKVSTPPSNGEKKVVEKKK